MGISLLGLVAALLLAVGRLASDGCQQAVDGGSTHDEDALSNNSVQVEMPVPLQGGDETRQDRLETFATDAVRCFPQDDEGLAHRLVIGTPSHGEHVGSEGIVGGEQSDGMLAMAASHSDELVEDLGLVVLGGLLVTLTQQFEQLAPGLLADLLVCHCVPPMFGNILLRQRSAFGNQIDESMRPGIIVVVHQACADAV